MKLLTKYNRINIIASVVVFTIGCTVFYFVLNYVLIRQLDESLDAEKAEVSEYAKEHNSLPEIINTDDQQTYFTPVAAPVTGEKYTSQITWNEIEKEREWTRSLLFGLTASGIHYSVTIKKSQEQKDDFLKLVLLIGAGMIAAILLAGYIINRIILKNLWKPFYVSIAEAMKYNLQQQSSLKLPQTGIDEFTLLNKSLNAMTARAESDYGALKEFSGNAAHEMQTPLAVISANTESLMQDEAVLISHHASIESINEAAQRLSKLNQSLLLLTKIEQQQFEMNGLVQWDILIRQRLKELLDLTAAKKITVTEDMVPVAAIFHYHLADILITNLLNNAIRYNAEQGKIDIQLSRERLAIANTSDLPALDPAKIFTRFYRHPQTKKEGTGLGLPIAAQICTLAGCSLEYQYRNAMHVFSIRFA